MMTVDFPNLKTKTAKELIEYLKRIHLFVSAELWDIFCYKVFSYSSLSLIEEAENIELLLNFFTLVVMRDQSHIQTRQMMGNPLTLL